MRHSIARDDADKVNITGDETGETSDETGETSGGSESKCERKSSDYERSPFVNSTSKREVKPHEVEKEEEVVVEEEEDERMKGRVAHTPTPTTTPSSAARRFSDSLSAVLVCKLGLLADARLALLDLVLAHY